MLALALASCAPSGPSQAQTQAAQCAATTMPPAAYLAPPGIANKPGYIELNASVAGQFGSPIVGLKQADFSVDTSGTALPIAFLRENTRVPVSIGILVDSSGSMQPKLPTVKLALAEFIGDLGPSDQVFLIVFTFKPFLLQPLTTDHRAVVQSLSKLRAFGQTSIYDPIVSGVGYLAREATRRRFF